MLFYYFIFKIIFVITFREILMEFINGPVSELSINDLTYWIQSKFLSFLPLTSDCSVAPFPPILCSLCTLHVLLGELFCSSWASPCFASTETVQRSSWEPTLWILPAYFQIPAPVFTSSMTLGKYNHLTSLCPSYANYIHKIRVIKSISLIEWISE